MSAQLWAAYYDDDVDTFRQLLATPASHGRTKLSSSPGAASALSASPTLLKSRKVSGIGHGEITRTGINMRDACGLTLLHHTASSRSENAASFAQALLEHTHIDLYLQDYESGWTALHRAFYFGNISIARMILEREADSIISRKSGAAPGLIKVKDREGHGPLDLFAATITDRTLRPEPPRRRRDSSSSDGEDEDTRETLRSVVNLGDEVYTFGSNKNITLGFGDEDDRQFPERITLRRPESLIKRFHREASDQWQQQWSSHETQITARTQDEIPWLIKMRPIEIKDVVMAKYHTAVLTTDPESNLYMCGHGQGGRLGTGDERTRFHFVCIDNGALAGKHIAEVALGRSHTIAITSEGEIFTWGSNGFGQLGYSLPRSGGRDEEPISLVARQIFGSLKREAVLGIAASSIHSVAFTTAGLYTFGKNEGQLGIVDSDARSLEVQITPRRVAASLFSSPISSISAIDKATICLLESHEVWVFANYGYTKVSFPLEPFTNYFLKKSFLATNYDTAPNQVVKVTSGGDTVCALSSRGEIFTLYVTRHDTTSSTSTTNPAKIRGAITQPQRVWSLKKGNMAARDVGVDADGSIILSTEEGSVWKRTKRAHMKDASTAVGDYRPKDYKFSRIPGLTRVLSVRASAFGAYAAIRKDCDVTRNQITIEDPTLWRDLAPLSPFKVLADTATQDEEQPRFWQAKKRTDELAAIKGAILEHTDVETLLSERLQDANTTCDAVVATTLSELRLPVHRWLLAGRSRVLRRGFRDLCATSTFTVPDLLVAEIVDGKTIIKFTGLDALTIIDLVLYLYTDSLVDFWHKRDAKENAYLYRQIRVELMKVASKLELVNLEPAVRQMIRARPCLDMDLTLAADDPVFFHDSDILVQLEDGESHLHSALACARCPFFEGLFAGRAGGRWLEGRYQNSIITVDLAHISKATFDLVRQHLYADTGPELFRNVVADDLDGFLDIVLDVLSAANELMLDRLSQVCQDVIGKSVNARNVSWLLNAISPSSVHEFKHASLEYLCLNLEAMLQGHYLNELEEDLLQELDEVVQQNQLNCMPFAKSSNAELSLLERHPELAARLEQARQIKADAMRIRVKYHETQAFQPGSLEAEHQSPAQGRSKRRPSQQGKVDERPKLNAKASTKDMMFAMDEEAHLEKPSPTPSPALRPMTTPQLGPIVSSSLDDQWYDSRGKALASPTLSAQRSPMFTPQHHLSQSGTPQTPRSPQIGAKTPPNTGSPWLLTPLADGKSGLRDIMAQTSGNQVSALSQKLRSAAAMPSPTSTVSKMSQKERKKMQQQSKTTTVLPDQVQSSPGSVKSSPWQTVSSQRVPSLKDVLDTQKQESARPSPSARSSTTPQLTMRQTVAGTPQTGSVSNPKQRSTSPHDVKRSVTPAQPIQSPPKDALQSIPQSIRHQPRPVESALQLSISDIVAQQQLEKDIIREAVAKRDLQDIQAEQEFQEWWDKESRRVQEAEQKANAPARPPRRPKIRGGKQNSRHGKGKTDAV